MATSAVPKAKIPNDPIPAQPEKPVSAIELLQSGPFSFRESAIEQFDEFFSSILEQNALSPEQQASLGENLKGAIEKRDRLGALMNRLDAEAELLRAEEQRIATRRRLIEKVHQCVHDSLHVQMENWGVLKVEGHRFTFTVKKNPPKLEILNESEVPPEFIDYAPTFRKSDIKAFLETEDGKLVAWARITQGTRLEIK